jgi:hypothetical protein
MHIHIFLLLSFLSAPISQEWLAAAGHRARLAQGATYLMVKAFNKIISNSTFQFAASLTIRALSAHSAAKFNISPGRWQQVWLVAIVPPKRWGEMVRNDCHTAWRNFKTLISSLHHFKNYARLFSLIFFF